MASLSTAIFYIFIFLTVYVQVFLLITFIENRKKIIIRSGSIKLRNYPAVTLVVPCWNEEGTVDGTVRSLLNLNYPKDKIKIFLIDDGSTDGTWDIINKFSNYPNIKVFRKENGGKYTALNLGLAHVETEFFGGILLVAGFLTQPAAFLLAVNMLVAIWKLKFKQGLVGGYEFDLALLAMALALLVLGPGAFSLDLPL